MELTLARTVSMIDDDDGGDSWWWWFGWFGLDSGQVGKGGWRRIANGPEDIIVQKRTAGAEVI